MLTFTPNGELASALERSRRDVQQWFSAIGEHKESKLREWAGAHLEDLKRSRDFTLRSLHGASVDIRRAAASLMAEYWNAAEPFAAAAIRLAIDDADPIVRGAALVAVLKMKHLVDDPTGFLRALLADLFPREANQVSEAVQREARARFHYGNLRKMRERIAGPYAQSMLESRTSAESFLAHPDPVARCGALVFLKNHWKPNETFAATCERLVSQDPDPKVRALAMACLAGCHAATDDRRVGDFVARFVHDDSSPVELRTAAYLALFTLRGVPLWEAFKGTASEVRIPDDVEWAFVDSFLSNGLQSDERS